MEEDDPNYNHNDFIFKKLQPGDLIEFPRGVYSHWAVYVGDGDVVHLAGEDNDGLNAELKPEHMFTICGKEFNKAKVCKENFWKVVGDSKALKNNENDKKLKPRDAAEIVQKACERLGEIGYNLIYSNCEHFATWCRYGISKSDQFLEVLDVWEVLVQDGWNNDIKVDNVIACAVEVVGAIEEYLENDKEENEEDKTKPLKQK